MSTPTDQPTAADPGDAAASRVDQLKGYLPARREALWLLGGGVVGAAFTGGTWGAQALGGEVEPESRDDDETLTSKQVLRRLVDGNARFAAGTATHPDQGAERRYALRNGQAPVAAVLSCADSRVPPELIFDQGLGDLFVVRSAGQVIDRAVLGSLQYGVGELHVPLVVVLGHTRCGAVRATVEAVEKKAKPTGTDIDALVAAIRPSVEEAHHLGATEKTIVGVSAGLNVEQQVERLRAAAVLSQASKLRKTKIVGASYDVTTGEVEWL